MRADQMIELVREVLRELDGPSSRSAAEAAGTAAETLRRQRQAMLLEWAVSELGPSLPGFRSRLAWRLPSGSTAASAAPAQDEALAAQAGRIARDRLAGAEQNGGSGALRPSRLFDAALARLIPGIDGAEIRSVALSGGRPGRSPADSAESRPAGARLLAALAVIAVTLREEDRAAAAA
ncbi:hypothetical protein FFK22_004770 [Mycobacterium sp. KBS0706]|uniref:hypothetical protein n=1 Tax=Mycobacterium sp. KBS0706 TaxID=2578109 RepID=UPI00110FD992|nr:hypothetical protein [Mycobacterium sp. KBS0706]TSD89833.1 hypothetical protein FFK22_004770 [Mycobacterium sp. KBS0706]